MKSQDPSQVIAERILSEYDAKKEQFEKFLIEPQKIIEAILALKKIGQFAAKKQVHKVEARVKGRKELERKLLSPAHSYKSLSEITDVCALRIITFYADDVPKIYRFIKPHFKVHKANDKGNELKDNEFGYLSFHCIVSLRKRYIKLPIWKPFAGLKLEIQIRSILQHAWAEIEHDSGYKSTFAIPAQSRRRYSRLAGLLELGDNEFERIRDELAAYEGEIARGNKRIAIDKNSLTAFIKHSHEIQRIDSIVSRRAKLRLVFSDTFIEAYVPRFAYLGIASISKVDSLLRKREAFLTEFVSAWYKGPRGKGQSLLPQGIGGSFLCWAIAYERGGLPLLRDFVKRHAFKRKQTLNALAAMARDLETAYKEARQFKAR